MKKLLTITLLAGFIFMTTNSIQAHPGANSWDGCHYCKTNCKKWGYTTGTRHCKSRSLIPQFGIPDPKYYR